VSDYTTFKMDLELKKKNLQEWIGGHFRNLKTFAEPGDPRRYIFAALMMKYATRSLANSKVVGEVKT